MKPLGTKAYGSIPHLANSRLGQSDKRVEVGQDRICQFKARDKYDKIYVQEKLDGSCVSVAKIDGTLYALTRAGYLATSSKFRQHHLFDQWVWMHQERFMSSLGEGERIVGEWLAQVHGTLYQLGNLEPFVAFDVMSGTKRICYEEFSRRLCNVFRIPQLLWCGDPITTEKAMRIHMEKGSPCDEPEGVIYRVERKGVIDFLAKWVRPDKVDGKFLPEFSGKPAVWNWGHDYE